jgi:hypothetical protein
MDALSKYPTFLIVSKLSFDDVIHYCRANYMNENNESMWKFYLKTVYDIDTPIKDHTYKQTVEKCITHIDPFFKSTKKHLSKTFLKSIIYKEQDIDYWENVEPNLFTSLASLPHDISDKELYNAMEKIFYLPNEYFINSFQTIIIPYNFDTDYMSIPNNDISPDAHRMLSRFFKLTELMTLKYF